MNRETIQQVTNYIHQIYKKYNFTDFDKTKKEIVEIIKIAEQKEKEPIQTSTALLYGKNVPILVRFSKKVPKDIKGRTFWVSKVKVVYINIGIGDQLSLLEETYIEAQPEEQTKDPQRSESQYRIVSESDLDKKMNIIERK